MGVAIVNLTGAEIFTVKEYDKPAYRKRLKDMADSEICSVANSYRFNGDDEAATALYRWLSRQRQQRRNTPPEAA